MDNSSEIKSFKRRDRLIEIEEEATKIWNQEKFHERDPIKDQKKFMVTFPYPYMNGRIHLGHAFSFTKAEFTVRFMRLKGFNAIWPFGFHCTGMPIAAAAQRLEREYNQHGENIKKWADDGHAEFQAQVAKAKEIEKAKKQASKGSGKAKGGNKEEKKEEKKKEEKFEVTAKLSQYTILRMCDIKDEDIAPFKDPIHWFKVFPRIGMQDLERFGIHADFRRSFITTSLNPYYDAFVRWQFYRLKDKGLIDFGKRPTVFSPIDGQACADHDRASGEGATPQEYTNIKLRLLEFPDRLKALEGKNVYLVAATLRPETMYGQTNCYILPEGKYGAYEMKNDEVYICSERSARGMAYQDLTKESQKLSNLLDIQGKELVGLACKAPLTSYEKIYLWPMKTISMKKGTGIVTSVPSDSPDDYINLKELQSKPAWREQHGLKDHMVVPFNPVSIMSIEGLGDLSAVKTCEDLKVNGPGDKEKLAKAKEICYDGAFYKGIMSVGKYKGEKVEDAKNKVKADMIADGEAFVYFEPTEEVVSRSGDVCVVAYCDQWYLKYGQEDWQAAIKKHVNSDNFNSYNPSILKAFQEAIDWLKDWAVSRNFGAGTRVPWDEKFLIESLSDSTIYMSYYTIAHHLQGDLEGSKPGPLGIEAKQLTPEVFDYIYLSKEYKADFGIPEDKLKTLRDEFNYWYPMDLRVSGKDLVRNHLTMSLYNHAAIWDESKFWPRGFFCNGWITVDGEKMSKSKGNFLTLKDCISFYGADATRVALADAGDTLDDANFVHDTANQAILKLANLDTWISFAYGNMDKMRSESSDKFTEFADNSFNNAMDQLIYESEKAYQSMRYRDVLKYCLYDFVSLREEYLISTGENPKNYRRDLIIKYIQTQLLLLYPICPHFAEVLYAKGLRQFLPKEAPDFISNAKFPEIDISKVDFSIIKAKNYVQDVFRSVRLALDKVKNKKITKASLVYAHKYYDWQIRVLQALKACTITEDFKIFEDWKSQFTSDASIPKKVQTDMLKFGSYIIKQMETLGKDALEEQLPFDEVALLQLYLESLKVEFKLEFSLVEVGVASESTSKIVKTAASNTTPGKPQVIFE